MTARLNQVLVVDDHTMVRRGLKSMVPMEITDRDHERRNRVALIGLVMFLSLAFVLIIGMDRSNNGLIQVSQKTLMDLQQKLLLSP